jgi:hypothetical protein
MSFQGLARIAGRMIAATPDFRRRLWGGLRLLVSGFRTDACDF